MADTRVVPGDEYKEMVSNVGAPRPKKRKQGEDVDTHDDGLEGNEVQKKRKVVEDESEGDEVPEQQMGEESPLTLSLFAGIIPFLRLHYNEPMRRTYYLPSILE